MPEVTNQEEAYTVLFTELHAPAFFHKLASHGVVPQNDREREELLDLGYQLHQKFAADEKQASDQSRFSGILAEVTGKPSVDKNTEALIKAASADLAKDPRFASAVLQLTKAAQAQLVG